MRSNPFSAGNVFLMIFLAIILLFVWSRFTDKVTCTTTDLANQEHGCEVPGDTYTTFEMPDELGLQNTSLWILKLALIGVAVFLAYTVIIKLNGGRITKRDIMTLVMLGVAVYFAWEYIIVKFNLFGADNFNELTFKTAAKLGLLK